MYEADMSTVAAPDELVPEGTYHVRVAKVEEQESKNSGKPMIVFTFKVQDEGPAFGRQISAFASLQSNALFTLKGIYKACGYNPGPEGHDPVNCLDSELYVKVIHEMREGSLQLKLPPYGFKPLVDPKGR
jgi:hypothetical protein